MFLSGLTLYKENMVTETYLNSVHPANIHVTVRNNKRLNGLVSSC